MSRPVALVTGASSGIGRATVLGLLDAGLVVHAAARRTDRMRDLADAGAHVLAMDVTDDASMVDGAAAVLESGRLDVLVNNAGYGSFGALEDVPADEARRQVEVNVLGLARLTQLVLPAMRTARSGRVVNVSSVGGTIYEPLGSWYHATKFAVEGLSDSLRVELRPFGVDVVLVQPGPVRTEWNRIARENLLTVSAGSPYARQAASVARVLERADRPGAGAEPEEVAATVVRAATAARPRTRYPVGRGARTLMLARRALPDRAFDAVLERVYLR
ncbi:oxidoreductase [Cellulomonas carbonis]|uniref:Short-chain dehydrogenase n=1 Tax=Cellulomonas carbonis T26 TaxID=947969 RepID=A0A0A0BRH7_9CELL|nr:oxidoreductase [Cellulomonas carbonis]KGM10576.1 short-chain dehydrogenase [Cellulomonas carbonis T26]GGB98594.1 short-chain dehydrogenase/reductase [Cellulomonas carbonis]